MSEVYFILFLFGFIFVLVYLFSSILSNQAPKWLCAKVRLFSPSHCFFFYIEYCLLEYIAKAVTGLTQLSDTFWLCSSLESFFISDFLPYFLSFYHIFLPFISFFIFLFFFFFFFFFCYFHFDLILSSFFLFMSSFSVLIFFYMLSFIFFLSFTYIYPFFSFLFSLIFSSLSLFFYLSFI